MSVPPSLPASSVDANAGGIHDGSPAPLSGVESGGSGALLQLPPLLHSFDAGSASGVHDGQPVPGPGVEPQGSGAFSQLPPLLHDSDAAPALRRSRSRTPRASVSPVPRCQSSVGGLATCTTHNYFQIFYCGRCSCLVGNCGLASYGCPCPLFSRAMR